MSIKGIENVRRNIKKTFTDIEGKNTHRAVFAVLTEIGSEAAHRTPIDTSNLINSQYQPLVFKMGNDTVGYIGYTAEYAKWVHDMPGTLKGQPRPKGQGNYWGPQGEPQFLLKAGEYVEKNSALEILKGIYAI